MHFITYTWVLQFLTMFRIPHPGRVGGRIFIEPAMPLMLSWVLGGNGLDYITLFQTSILFSPCNYIYGMLTAVIIEPTSLNKKRGHF